MELSLNVRTVGDRSVLDVVGEVDVYSAPELRERLVRAAQRLRARPWS